MKKQLAPLLILLLVSLVSISIFSACGDSTEEINDTRDLKYSIQKTGQNQIALLANIENCNYITGNNYSKILESKSIYSINLEINNKQVNQIYYYDNIMEDFKVCDTLGYSITIYPRAIFKHETDSTVIAHISYPEQGAESIKLSFLLITKLDDQGLTPVRSVSNLKIIFPLNISNTANFTADKDTVFVGSQVQFTDQSQSNPVSWNWDFGDWNTSTEQNPTHTYLEPGNYFVRLISTFQDNSIDTIGKFISVIPQPDSLVITHFEILEYPETNSTQSRNWDETSDPDLYLDIQDPSHMPLTQSSVVKNASYPSRPHVSNLSNPIVFGKSDISMPLPITLYDEDVQNDQGAMDDYIGSIYITLSQITDLNKTSHDFTNTTKDISIRVYYSWK